MRKYDPKYIDPEEKDLMKDIQRMDVGKVKRPAKRQQERIRKAARSYVISESKMNIRIAASELAEIKSAAAREGLKYQSLVKSVLHKYITGQLVERQKKAI
jgi:predicted DNA binding CopG/RHH family protein